MIKFRTADGQWHEPTNLQVANGLGISAVINGGNVEASASTESSQVQLLRWNMQMNCDAVANVAAIKIDLHNNAAIVAKVLVSGPRGDSLVNVLNEEKFAEVNVIKQNADYIKTVVYQGSTRLHTTQINQCALTVTPLYEGLANVSFVRAKTYREELPKTATQADSIADEKNAENKVTVEKVNAKLNTFTNLKSEAGGFQDRYMNDVLMSCQ